MENKRIKDKYFKGENIHCILEVACEFVYLKLKDTYFKRGGGVKT